MAARRPSPKSRPRTAAAKKAAARTTTRPKPAARPRPRAVVPGPTTGVAEVDAYIAACPPAARKAMTALRRVVRTVARGAEERLSYGMPAWFLDGVVVYVGAFTSHIGIFPPVRGDARLLAAIAPYANPRGNLAFPLARAMPLALFKRVVAQRLLENALRRRVK